MQFTERNLRKLEPKDKPYRVYENGNIQGFHVQVSKAGRISYVLAYSHQGSRRFLKVGTLGNTTVTDAKSRARSARGKIEEGIDPRVEVAEKAKPKVKAATVRQLFDAYLEDAERRGVKSLYMMGQIFKANVPDGVLQMEASAVTPAEIHAILRPLVQRGSKTMANRTRQYLRAAWQYGLKAEFDPNRDRTVSFGLTYNPVAAIPSIEGAEKARERVLTLDEIGAVWRAAPESGNPETTGALMALIASGGCRVQEVTNIKWEDIDWEDNTIYIPVTKTKQPRVHPMGTHMREVFEWIRPVTGDKVCVFPGFRANSTPVSYLSVAAVVRRLRKAQGMVDWVAKDLRRTCATMLAEAGVPKDHRMALLGHAATDTHGKHYDKYEMLAEKAEAVKVWDSILKDAIG